MRRPERVAETVRAEIIQIVGYELDDPRVLSVTVTDIKMSDDLRDARVFVTIEGDEREAREALKALRHAEIYVRRQLGFALNLRHAPHIHFVRDTVEERAQRVDALLAEIKFEPDSPESLVEETLEEVKG